MKLPLLETLLSPLNKKAVYTAAELAEAEQRLELKLPQALKTIYLQFGKNNILNGCSFLEPPKYLRVYKESLTFYLENQGCAAWFLKVKELEEGKTNVYVVDDAGDVGLVDTNLETFFIRQCLYNGSKGLFPFFTQLDAFFPSNEYLVQQYLGHPRSSSHRYGYDMRWYWKDMNCIVSVSFKENKGRLLIYSKTATIPLSFIKSYRNKEWKMRHYKTAEERSVIRSVLHYEEEILEEKRMQEERERLSNSSMDIISDFDHDLPF